MTTLLQSCFCCPASLKEIFLAASHWTGYGWAAVENELNDLKLTPNSIQQDPTDFWRRDSFSKHICNSATARESLKFPLLSCDGAPFSSSLKRWAFHMTQPAKERFPGAETRVVTSLTLSEPTQHSIWSQGVYMAEKSRDLKWSEYVKQL